MRQITQSRLTTRTRLALGFAAALAAVLAGFSAAAYVTVSKALVAAVDARLRTRVESVEHDLDVDPSGRVRLAGRRGQEDMDSPLTEIVRIPSGQVVYRSDDLEDDVLDRTGPVRREILEWKTPRSVFLASGHEVRLMAVRASAGGAVYEVWMADSLDPARAEERRLAWVFAVLFPLAVVLAALLGRVLAGRAIRPIEDALAAARRFTADASHELRTPLATIRTECEVTLRRDRSPDEYRTSLRSVLEEAVRLSGIAGRLLDLSRADAAGGLLLERRAVPVDALARNLCDMWASVAAERGIALSCEAGEFPATVEGDPSRLRELLENLLDNALKYTGAGGRAVVRVTAEGRSVIVSVEDTGPGIAREHLPLVFDRFYRADPARGRGGVGLGLAIAKALAEAHGGTIEVASELRKGSTFSVRLPRRG